MPCGWWAFHGKDDRCPYKGDRLGWEPRHGSSRWRKRRAWPWIQCCRRARRKRCRRMGILACHQEGGNSAWPRGARGVLCLRVKWQCPELHWWIWFSGSCRFRDWRLVLTVILVVFVVVFWECRQSQREMRRVEIWIWIWVCVWIWVFWVFWRWIASFLKMDCWVCVCILFYVLVCVCCFCVWLTRKISCWVCVWLTRKICCWVCVCVSGFVIFRF